MLFIEGIVMTMFDGRSKHNKEVIEEVRENLGNLVYKTVIPRAIKDKKVNSYIFNGYWEDIGTIRSFYNATLDLTTEMPPFNFYDADAPIYTHMRNLPPPKINGAPHIENSLITEGAMLNCKSVTKSVVGVRTIIREGSELDGVITMGADFYENEETKEENAKAGKPNIGIGKNCKIAKTIIDKDAAIGDNVRINVDGKTYPDGENKLENGVTFYSSDGIIVIRKGAVIPSGTVI